MFNNLIKKIANFFKTLFGIKETRAAKKRRPRRRKRKGVEGASQTASPAAASSALSVAASSASSTAVASVPEKKKPSAPATAPAPLSGSHQQLEKKPLGEWMAPALPENREEGVVYFQEFALEPEIMKAAVGDLGFVHCTPIQGKALPVAMDGRDIAGKAQTGTGKTAVFLISMLHQFLLAQKAGLQRKLNQPFAFVLAPTRELAIQIAKDAENLSVYTSLRTVAVFGGMDYERQRRLLSAGCDLVVGTPGRLIDFLQQRVLDTSMVKVLIIDEADRMLDMGFIPDVKRIINYLPYPRERQTMLFSATLSQDILALASRWMRPDPAVVEVEPEHVVAEGVNETVYACTSKEKLAIMLWIIQHEDCHRALIFRNRRRDVEQLNDLLHCYGINSEMLSGDVDQNKRLRILEQFRSGAVKVVVATDVAGRGIQVDDVTHVFNYDLPYEAEDYVHRVGRTARAGHKGRAIAFASEDCAYVIPDIEEYIGRSLPITQPEEEMLVLPPKVASMPVREYHDSHRTYGGGSSFHASRRR